MNFAFSEKPLLNFALQTDNNKDFHVFEMHYYMILQLKLRTTLL